MTLRFFLTLTGLLFANCNNSGQHSAAIPTGGSKVLKKIAALTDKSNFEETEIICDTVYKSRGYKLTLIRFDTTNSNETIPNTLFTLSKQANGQYLPIYSDSIFNTVQEVHFTDFNNDNIKDILVQNISDVRSNWTYYLYLVDTAHDKLKRIKGFEEIKNPNYLPQYNLIDNYVMSGKNWTSFYKINGDSIKNFEIVIDDDQTENGTYGRDYKKAIKTIMTKERNNR